MENKKEFLTTKEISKIYKVSEYVITQSWIPKGLKFFPSRPFKFRLEWVEEFIEKQMQAERLKRQEPVYQLKGSRLKRKPCITNNGEMKIRLEDFFPERERKNA